MFLYDTDMPNTTIIVEKSTRDNLRAIGKKAETYDNIVCDLLEFRLRASTAGLPDQESGEE